MKQKTPADDSYREPVEQLESTHASSARFTEETSSADWQAAPFQLGQHTAIQRFDNPLHGRVHILAFLQQARHQLRLYSNELAPWLYDHPSVQQASRRFLLRNPRCSMRILLRDSRRMFHDGHSLLNLAHRLPSRLHIRTLTPEQSTDWQELLLADDVGLLRYDSAETGQAIYRDRAAVKHDCQIFDALWESAQTDPNLRRFLL